MKYKKIRTSEIIPNMSVSTTKVINNIDYLINTYDEVYMYYVDVIHHLYLTCHYTDIILNIENNIDRR